MLPATRHQLDAAAHPGPVAHMGRPVVLNQGIAGLMLQLLQAAGIDPQLMSPEQAANAAP
jgi:hypothetical protein